MFIPEKVRVGSVDYNVTVADERLILDTQQCSGTVDYGMNEINIDSGIQSKEHCEITFLHELVHAIFNERNLYFPEFGIDGDIEEKIVNCVAYGLHQVVKDNPQVFTQVFTQVSTNFEPYKGVTTIDKDGIRPCY